MLNWFLPSVGAKNRKKGIRRMLGMIGPTWVASPVRRVIQVTCFALFIWLFVYVCWPYTAQPSLETTTDWPSHYADELGQKSFVPPEIFLSLDPLVGLSSWMADCKWTSAALFGLISLGICILIPRYFCGYVCPLGTLIDFFDWLIWRRIPFLRVKRDGIWVDSKYFVLMFVFGSAMVGAMTAGFVAAIPVVTRAFAFIAGPLELGLLRSWHQVPTFGPSQYLSIGLFVAILSLSLMRPRFWCRYVCPSGALFSIASMFRLTQRKVKPNCVACNRCRQVCPFDAVEEDFTTRGTDCTFCQTCGGTCPVQAIEFTTRFSSGDDKYLKPSKRKPNGNAFKKPPTEASDLSATTDDTSGKQITTDSTRHPFERRRFLGTGMIGAGFFIFGSFASKPAYLKSGKPLLPPEILSLVRPPAAVPEADFLSKCIRCGKCLQVCPNSVLQPVDASISRLAMWTPAANLNWSGCEASCNLCTQICPTGAIRAVSLEEKRHAKMGLAVIHESTCLPYAGREACDLCYQECESAGYHAIEFIQVGTEVDEFGLPIEDSGFLAPKVLTELCVGCGLCQSRCNNVNHKTKGLLEASAVVVDPTEKKSDRIPSGSFVELRRQEQLQREQEEQLRQQKLLEQMQQGSGRSDPLAPEPGDDSQGSNSGDDYLPDFLK